MVVTAGTVRKGFIVMCELDYEGMYPSDAPLRLYWSNEEAEAAALKERDTINGVYGTVLEVEVPNG